MPRFLSCAFQLAATSLKAVAEQIAHCRGSERKKSPPVRLRHARQLAAARQNQEEADRTILYSLAHLVGGSLRTVPPNILGTIRSDKSVQSHSQNVSPLFRITHCPVR